MQRFQMYNDHSYLEMPTSDYMGKKRSSLSKIVKWFYWFCVFLVLFIVWKLNNVEKSELDVTKQILLYYKDELRLTQEQLDILKNLGFQEKASRPKIYAITPTYSRLVQKAELTRLSQTLSHIPNLHWIVVEDASQKSQLVADILRDSTIEYTHLCAMTPPAEKLHGKMPHYAKHRGVDQRNAGLKWLRDNLDPDTHKGVVYFMDDDNTYSIKLFKEIDKVKKVGVWPVGLVGGWNVEAPVVNMFGKVTHFATGWKANRTFAIDMAGFAINLDIILRKEEAAFSHTMKKGLLESQFLSFFTTIEGLEPLADNCTKVYVWHTRTENPKIRGKVPGIEV